MSQSQAAFDAFASSSVRMEVADGRWEEAQTLLQLTEDAEAAGRVTADEREQCLLGVMARLFLQRETQVAITGLSTRADLNGCIGTIAGDIMDGRIPVEVRGAHVRLRPCNMRPVDGASGGELLVPGTLVELKGLSAKHLNACIGEVLPCDDLSERVPVRVHVTAAAEPKSVLVRRANLGAVSAARSVVDGECMRSRRRYRRGLA